MLPAPNFGMSHAFLAAAQLRLGAVEDAKAEVRLAVAFDPNFSINRFSIAPLVSSRLYLRVRFRCCGRLLHRHVSAMKVGAV